MGAVAALGLLATAAPAQTSSSGATKRSLAVTVYNQNLGLVHEERSLDLRAGLNRVRYADVAALLDPTSVHLVPVGGGDFRVLEQNFQYDLVSGDRLLERSIGSTVRAVGEKGDPIEGSLLSFDGGSLVVQTPSGVKILNRGSLRELSIGGVPGGLISKPTLEWAIESPASGTRKTALSYLTGGLAWHAEYVAVVNADDTGLSLGGWASVDNRSGATYENASLKLVAGDVNLVRQQFDVAVRGGRMASELAAPPQFEERQFFEYHLYDLQRPTTIADRETKQISLFDPAEVRGVQKKYTFDRQRTFYRGPGAPAKVAVTLEFKNSRAAGLGMPLPGGKVRIYKQDQDGTQQFAGEDLIQHTPTDETLRLAVGNAFDLVGEHRQLDTERINDRSTRMSFEVSLRNRKREEVTITVLDHFWGDWDVEQSSHAANKKDASTLEIPVRIPAGQEIKVTYSVRQRS
jgi:hypothetical protein